MDRDDGIGHRKLRKLSLAYRVDSQSTQVIDYHTTQVPTASQVKKRPHIRTRRDELAIAPEHELTTVLSERGYYCDVRVLLAISANKDSWSLTELAAAIKQPKWTPTIGRKSCFLSLPCWPQIVLSESLNGAAECYFYPDTSVYPDQEHAGTWHWDDHYPAGLDVSHIEERRDDPVDRATWRFAVREEMVGFTAVEEDEWIS